MSDHDPQTSLTTLMQAIAAGDEQTAARMLDASPGLAAEASLTGASSGDAEAHFLGEIQHYVYAGDTALHIAAAAYAEVMVDRLISRGTDPRARNRRGAEPVHYAVDGIPGSAHWNPAAQAATVSRLIAAGADPDARDGNGATPLHRAARTRCAAALRALLDGGADAGAQTPSGATPRMLAERSSGRGGTGSPEARAGQAEILRMLDAHGMP